MPIMTLFLDPSTANQYQCPICMEIYKEPVQVECNEHIFCNNCVNGLISSQGRSFKCPLCRKKCSAKAVTRVKFIDRQIGNLKVKCQNKVGIQNNNMIEIKTQNNNKTINTESNNNNNNNNNKRRQMDENEQFENANKRRKLNENETYEIVNFCGWTGSYSDLNNHIKTCPLQLIKCKYCNISILQRELNDHHKKCQLFPLKCIQCNKTKVRRNRMPFHIAFHCPMTIIKCDECKQEIRRKDEKLHLKNICPEAVIKCVFYEFGCKEKLKRKNEKNHIENAAFTHSHLVQISKTVKTLKIENKKLNKRVGVLENKQKAIEQSLMIQIYVKTIFNGRTITLKVKQFDSIGSIKSEIQRTGGFQYQLRLIFAGRELEDHRSLLNYDIFDGSTLHLVLRIN